MPKENSKLYHAINAERIGGGFRSQAQLSRAVNRQDSNFWNQMKKGKTQFNDVVLVCDLTGLELVIRNPKTGSEHKLNGND